MSAVKDPLVAAQVIARFESTTEHEIAAMAALVDALSPLDLDARRRVLGWAGERFTSASRILQNANQFSVVVTTMLADLATAIDIHHNALDKAKQEPTPDEAKLFGLLAKWRGEVA